MRFALRAGISLSFLALTMSATGIAFAADWFVNAAVSSGNGSSAKPFSKITQALKVASSGDHIKVTAGQYNETIALTKALKDIQIEGGYLPDFTSREPWTNTTSILGSSTSDTISIVSAGQVTLSGLRIAGGSRGVYINDATGTIKECLIENNHQPGSDSRGGGIYGDTTDLTISGCTIQNNSAGHGGGIAIVHGGTLIIEDNRVISNEGNGDHGGGMYVSGVNTTITRNYIAKNKINLDYGFGGGLIFFNPGNNAHLSYNIFTENFAPSRGGAVFIDEGASAVLEHELIFANQCGMHGGAGVMVDGGAGHTVVTIRYSSIVDNNCPNSERGGNGVFLEDDAELALDSCILWGNADMDFHQNSSGLTVNYTSSQSGFSGKGNIKGDPLFADANNHDYHVKSKAGRYDSKAEDWVKDSVSSPTLDKGNPDVGCPNEPVPNGARVDMGAFANTGQSSKSESSQSCGDPTDGGWADAQGGSGGGSGGSSGSSGGPGGSSGSGGSGGSDTDASPDNPGIVSTGASENGCSCSLPGASPKMTSALVSILSLFALGALFTHLRKARR